MYTANILLSVIFQYSGKYIQMMPGEDVLEENDWEQPSEDIQEDDILDASKHSDRKSPDEAQAA